MTVSLIPAGGPHGARQEAEVASKEAGLATKAPQAPTEITAPRPGGAVQQATNRERGQFDAIQSRTPQSSGQLRETANSRIVEVLATSPSAQMRDLASRLRGI